MEYNSGRKYPDDSLAKKSQLIIDNFWIIKDINYSIVTEIKATCGMSKMAVTAEEGHIITINGNFSVPPNTNKSIMLSDIKLSGGYSDETKKTSWEFEPTAFGMGGKGSCSFYYEECIVKGAFSVEDLSGHGIKFDREKEGGPGELSIIGNIVPLCFAFPAPEIPNDYLYLTFEYRDFPIKLKAKND